MFHNEDFHFGNIGMEEPILHKELSEKSCPVGNDDSQDFHEFTKLPRAYEEGTMRDEGSNPKEKAHKKFLKTKNLLRTLSTYLHKYIRYSPKCKGFIKAYY